jgi:polar amino acid transport system substrate-binding protein
MFQQGVQMSKVIPSASARSELTAYGKLRVAFPVASALYVVQDPINGRLSGVSPEIGSELAARLDVPFEPRPYATVRDLIQATHRGEWDIATIVIESERAKLLDFTKPYLEADSTFMVPLGSEIKNIADADVEGIRIGVAERSAFDLQLTRMIKHATLVRYPGVKSAFRGFKLKENDAVAAPRPVLAASLSEIPLARILDDKFDVAKVGLAIPKNHNSASLVFLDAFIDEVLMSGWLLQAIDRSGIVGIRIA